MKELRLGWGMGGMREGGDYPELRKPHVCQLIESGCVVQRCLRRDTPMGGQCCSQNTRATKRTSRC